ncbi:MAG: glycerol kinase GlpK [Acidobacteria bacterium]|nr:glycerol kinase GlpK [Acidobacteriota bacterium]
MPAHVLAIDQGTTNTKALLIDDEGRVVARASRPVAISFPQPGWVEQDGAAIWQSVEDAIEACLGDAPARPDVVGVANQRESVLVWARDTGRPAGPCIVWQCRRTSGFCDELRRRGLQEAIEAKTGLTIDPLFSASKIRWLLDAIPNGHARAAAGELCAGTIDSWVLWNLTGGTVHACDATNASRTQLLDVRRGEWDDDLLALFGIPRRALPDVRPSSGRFGITRRMRSLPDGLPIASLIGDSHAALFGQGAFEPGLVKATYGTGTSLMTVTPAPVRSRHGLSATVAWALPDGTAYALEGNITMTGGAIDWLGQFLGLPNPASAVADLAATVEDAGGVYVVPAFAGLGAPYWDDRARGLIAGLTRGTTAAHVARATLESIAFQVRDVFDAMRSDAGLAPIALLADGGASRNDALMQWQADVLGCPVVRNASADLAAVGAAWLAGLAEAIWPSLDALACLPRQRDRFEPAMGTREREARYAGWVDAVERARSRAGGGTRG